MGHIVNPSLPRDKSFADDLNTEQSIVSGRVTLLLRSAEIQLMFTRFVLLYSFSPRESLPSSSCACGFGVGLFGLFGLFGVLARVGCGLADDDVDVDVSGPVGAGFLVSWCGAPSQ